MPENPLFGVRKENGEVRSACKSMNAGAEIFEPHGMKDRPGSGGH
jgi:hypothetical protein